MITFHASEIIHQAYKLTPDKLNIKRLSFLLDGLTPKKAGSEDYFIAYPEWVGYLTISPDLRVTGWKNRPNANIQDGYWWANARYNEWIELGTIGGMTNAELYCWHTSIIEVNLK